MAKPESAETPMPPPSYLADGKGVASWLFTTDHKRVAVLYLVSTMGFFLLAVGLGVLVRLELLSPGMKLFGSSLYNRILTLHGVIMIFLFIIPVIPAVLGNFFLPILIGARDVFFPRLNLASWYCYVAGGVLAITTVGAGGMDTGWTFYVPFSVQTSYNLYLPLFAAFILGWSSLLTGLNFITTVHRLRAPGMTWFKMPLFVWSLYASGWVQVVATPVIAVTLVLVMLDRAFGVGIFDPSRGGDPILYQHLFWIYSHPAVYIMILPAMGIISEIIPSFARKTIFGYTFIAFSSLAIALIGSLVWGHHMFVSGMSDEARILFSFLTFIVAVPSAVKVFNWLATLYRGSLALDPPLCFALVFIFLFSVGGLTGLLQGSLATDIHLHGTAFVVAHFHYVMFGGTAVALLGGFYYWFPKMFGRCYSKKAAYLGLLVFFIGFNLTYFSLFLAGLAGMPRRYADYPAAYTVYHRVSTVGSWIMVAGLLVLLGNLARSVFRGKPAPTDPWGGSTLEWRIPSPPPRENFIGDPDLRRGTYEYPETVAR